MGADAHLSVETYARQVHVITYDGSSRVNVLYNSVYEVFRDIRDG